MPLALLSFALLLGGCRLVAQAPPPVADPASGEVAFRFVGPGEAVLVVPVEINGEGPFDLVLDTGATFTCVTEPVARALALPDEGGVAGFGAGVGGSGEIRIVRLEALRVGGIRVEGVQACVLDLAHLGALGVEVDGLLGLNVLRQFRLTVDFGRNVLRLDPPE